MPTLTASTDTILKTGNLLRSQMLNKERATLAAAATWHRAARAQQVRRLRFFENEHV
jgi:hypothetical protein